MTDLERRQIIIKALVHAADVIHNRHDDDYVKRPAPIPLSECRRALCRELLTAIGLVGEIR